MKRWAWVEILAAGLTTAAARGADEASSWKHMNATSPGGPTASAWKLTVWPGKDQVIVSTRANGLWSTTDGGDTWGRMGDHVDGFAVDFTDPNRATQLMGLHEQEHSLHKSTDGGATWVKIGDKVPEGTAFTTDPIILDANLKVTGDKPANVQVSLACGPSKVESEKVDVAKYAPDFMDGQWHRVTVPRKDLYGTTKFDPKTAYELRFLTDEAPENTISMYVDVVRLRRAPGK